MQFMITTSIIPHAWFRLMFVVAMLGMTLTSASIKGEEVQIERIHLHEVDSTQVFVKEHAPELVDVPGKWVVVTADRQTHGRGHQGRQWGSFCDDNIYATYLTLYPKNREEELFHVIQISALAVAKTLQEFHLEPGIKWINDVLLGGRKISGCLCEILPSQLDDYYYLLIGIGINVNMTLEELSKLSNPATSMYVEKQEKTDRELVLNSLSGYVMDSLDVLLGNGFDYFRDEINRLLVFKGKVIELEVKPNLIVQGRIIEIDLDGALLLQTQTGILSTFEGRILRVIDEA